MALTSIPTTAASAPQADKAISLNHNNGTSATNTIYYTVPVGRRFKGYLWINDVSYNVGKFPGHTTNEKLDNPHSTNTERRPIAIETGPGDFVSGVNQYAKFNLVGIEFDA